MANGRCDGSYWAIIEKLDGYYVGCLYLDYEHVCNLPRI